MKLVSSLQELVSIEPDDLVVGSLVRLREEPTSTGMIVQFLSDSDAVVLWSTPPRLFQKRYGNIW